MRPLRSDDPRRLGRYRLIGCLSESADGIPTPERVYVALTPDGHRTVLVATLLPEDAADPEHALRFQREAADEQRLSAMSPWLSRISDVSAPSECPPWRVWPYVPCLPLPEALAVNGGALPERSVRAIGAALAESVVELHGQGWAHAGISPRSVLIAGDRPRLTGFGAVRTAGPDGESRAALPGLPAQSISPEQLAGGRPRPLGDVYALGSVLSYAATGNPAADPEELPAGLEELISRCLSYDPADRPQLSHLLAQLTEPTMSSGAGQTGPAGFSAAAPATEVDAGTSRAAVLLVPGWLPRRLSAALGTEAAEVLGAEAEEQLDLVDQETSDETAAACFDSTTVTEDDSAEQVQGDRWSFARDIPRRTVIAAASGAAGLAVGGAVTWAATADDRPAPTAAQRLVASRKSKKRVGGTPPTPRWQYQIPGAAPRFPPLVCGHVVVFVSESAACGVDIRTGRQVWHTPTASASREPWKTDDGRLVLVPGKELTAVDAHTGHIRWRYDRSHERGPLPHPAVLAVDGTSLWCTTKSGSGSDTGVDGGRTVVAYEMAKRAEVWRQQVPAEFSEGHLLGDVLLLTTPSPPNTKGAKDKGKPRRFVALDRRTGKQHAKRSFDGVTTGQVLTSASGQLITAAGDRLRGYDAQHDGKVRWTVRTRGKTERERPPLGPPLVHGNTVYASDAMCGMQAVELPDGHVRWQSDAELPGGWNRLPRTSVTPSGHRLMTVNDDEVDAFDAGNGSLLWRFLDLPGKGRTTKGRRMVALTDHLAVVLSHGTAYALPWD